MGKSCPIKIRSGLPYRNEYIETRAYTFFARSLDDAIVVVYNFFDDSQPDAGARVFGTAVQPLKHFEDAFLVLR